MTRQELETAREQAVHRAEHLDSLANTAYGKSDLQGFHLLRERAAYQWAIAGRCRAMLAELVLL